RWARGRRFARWRPRWRRIGGNRAGWPRAPYWLSFPRAPRSEIAAEALGAETRSTEALRTEARWPESRPPRAGSNPEGREHGSRVRQRRRAVDHSAGVGARDHSRIIVGAEMFASQLGKEFVANVIEIELEDGPGADGQGSWLWGPAEYRTFRARSHDGRNVLLHFGHHQEARARAFARALGKARPQL